MLTVEEAEQEIHQRLSSLGEENIALDHALGRTLAADISAQLDIPHVDNSAMDGYAIIAEDCREASEELPSTLTLTSQVQAGDSGDVLVSTGEAARIFTGAPIPQGATCVVMQENTSLENSQLHVKQAPRDGEHIRKAGEDVARGSKLINRGTPIAPGHIAMLASQGIESMAVAQRPVVAIVPTGNEVIELGCEKEAHQIYNSNAHMLVAQVTRTGGVPKRMPIVRDTKEAVRDTLKAASEEADLILTIGGVSVGDFDFVRGCLLENGEEYFWKVAIKPGKPLLFGEVFGTPLLGLPGNPVSSFVSFELFGVPAIRRLLGSTKTAHPRIPVKLSEPLKPNRTRREFVRANVDLTSRIATTAKQRGSGALSSLLTTNALLDIPEGPDIIPTTEDVVAVLLGT